MESLGFRGRISTRPMVSSSRISSCSFYPNQGTSHPSTPVDSSTQSDCHKFGTATSTSSISSALMSFGLQSSPSSSQTPFLIDAQEQKGQFSDADADEEVLSSKYCKRKRGPPIFSPGINTKSPDISGSEISSSAACTIQLPMATRRLAMLVGIPESSQAIIQSTLPLPVARSNSGNLVPLFERSRSGLESNTKANTKHSLASSTEPLEGTKLKSPFSSLNSHNFRPPTISTINENYCDLTTLSPPFYKSPEVYHSNFNQAGTSSNQSNGRNNASDINSAPLRSHSLKSLSLDTRNPLTSPSLKNRAINAPPRFTRSTESSSGYIMPAPGTFSIRAPSLDIFRRIGSEAGSPEVSDWGAGSAFGDDHFQDALAKDGNEGNIRGISASASQPNLGINNKAYIALAEGNQKQKPRAQRKKSNCGSLKADSEVELVAPPPTINGKISHSRKVPPGYVKRTPNSFIMFRSHVIANKLLPPGLENDNRQISRVVSGLWAGLSEDDLRTWQDASRELRAAALAKNPNFKHGPTTKRREVVRRRRTGQLPGETPEQRDQREKAAAAAVVKVIIDSRGENLDQDKSVKMTGLTQSTSDKKQCLLRSSNPTLDVLEASQSRFRAPSNLVDSISTPAPASQSEYAESTMTTSPSADRINVLSCVLEKGAEVDTDRGSPTPTPSLSVCDTDRTAVTSIKQAANKISNNMIEVSQPSIEWFQALMKSSKKGASQFRDQNCDPSFDFIAQDTPKSATHLAVGAPEVKDSKNFDEELAKFCNLFGPEENVRNQCDSSLSFSDEMFHSFGLNASDFQMNSTASTASTQQAAPSTLPIVFENESTHSELFVSELSSQTSITAEIDPSSSLDSSKFDLSSCANDSKGLTNSETKGIDDCSTSSTVDHSVVSFEELSQITAGDVLDFDAMINNHFQSL
ncbi:hypothetical protein BY996DRAFT_6419841 [Phakopsora pachyrhizi]|nr:hypothetical protein BY996DRAFT_6419841 [Phakopsora pachyrhizi]